MTGRPLVHNFPPTPAHERQHDPHVKCWCKPPLVEQADCVRVVHRDLEAV